MRVTSGSVAAVALAIAACVGCSGKGASTAQASGGESLGEEVTAIGCPTAPKAGCVTITSQGKVYDITGAGVDLTKGVSVSLTGHAAGEVTACGAKLTDVQLDYLNLKCAAKAPPAH